MVVALFVICLFLLSVNIIGYVISAPRYSGTVSDHFDGRKFINPGTVSVRGLKDLLKWMLNRKRGVWKDIKITARAEQPPDRVLSGIRITFVNHSTFLIQADGLNVLTDPVWSERASPFSFIGPKRMRPPGIPFENLPKIDVVLLSHNHYDHLDLETMKRIFKIHKPRIITSLGVKAFIESEGITGSADLDWWEEYTLSDKLKVMATPSQHFSGRGTFDRDATLWCGYLIKRKEGNIYFVGDSGYNPGIFKEIGERGSPIQVALVPIGAYKPQWFMSPVHCSPEEAVQIHKDVKARQSIGMHFGTFPLADEGSDDLYRDIELGLKKHGVPPGDFIIIEEGEAKEF
ncbi:MAG: twin-arginine translocation pathway signal [Marivirga sp.]|nr:twin-arginine translocation pathway signal [Marivirga sp.]